MTSLERRIEHLKRDIERHENNNDGSISWVEELHELLNMLSELEMEACNDNC